MTVADEFLALHRPGAPLLLPNPWDIGSARLLVHLGFRALATTSGGFAAALGRLDGRVTRDEAIEHASILARAVPVPVSADLEQCFTDDPAGVADTVRLAVTAGLAGCSIEDWSGSPQGHLYQLHHAAARVEAAAEAAHSGPNGLVLTARAENHLRGNPDLSDTIARLQAYQEAGADVLYAPGLTSINDIQSVVRNVDRPVNVLALATVPPVSELSAAGVARVSIGSGFANVAWGALAHAAQEFKENGTFGWADLGAEGSRLARAAFS